MCYKDIGLVKMKGIGAAHATTFFEELIVVGGGIMKSKDKILPHLQQMIDNHAWLPAGTIKVVAATQVDFAGILGMEYLVSSILK